MSDCKHEQFQVRAAITRLKDSERFQADITIICSQCDIPFCFQGLKAGCDLNGAAMSLDGKEGRFAIYPENNPPEKSEGVSGFTVSPVDLRGGGRFG